MATEEEADGWDPLREDFNDKTFNSYQIAAASQEVSSSAVVQLFVAGIPPCLTEQGLRNLMSPVAKVLHVALVAYQNIGFVSVLQKDAVKMIGHFHNYKLGDSYLTVKLSDKQKPIRKERSAAVSGTATIISSVSNKDERKEEAVTSSFGYRFVDELKIPDLKFPTAAKYLQVGQALAVKVLNVVSPSQFWVHHRSDKSDSSFKELCANMYCHYSLLPPKSAFKPNGSGLYATCLRDLGWCRVQLLNFDARSVTVLLLDYGTCERVGLTDLHSLEGQFCSLPFQAICCSLAHVQCTPVWTEEAVSCMRHILSNPQVCAKVCAIDGYNLSVELIVRSGHTVNEVLVSRGHASYVSGFQPSSTETNKQIMEASVLDTSGSSEGSAPRYRTVGGLSHRKLTVGKQYDVVILDARDASDVTVCLKDSIGALNNLLTELNSYQLSGSYTARVGEIVVTQYARDGDCYRAEVSSLNDDDTAVVRFVDFGNTATVDTKSVGQLQPQHAAFPVYGINVKFRSSNIDGELLTEYSNLNLKVVEECDDHYVVHLAGDDTDMHLDDSTSEQQIFLISDLKPCCLDAGKTYTAWVTDGTDAEEFYVQVQDYEAISEQVQAIYSMKSGIYKPQQAGELVAIHLDVDDLWYRAVVKEIVNENAVKCQLIDFGIIVTTTSQNVSCFDSQLLDHPAFAFRCSFHNVVKSSGGLWEEKYLKPTEDVYSMTVVEVRDGLHFVELVSIESGVDLKQKLIDDGLLLKADSAAFRKLASGDASQSAGDNKSDGDNSFSVSRLKQRDTKYSFEQLLPTLSDAEIQGLCHNREKVLIVHANSPSDFYMQPCSDSVQKKLRSLQQSINTFCGQSACKPDTVEIGQILGMMYEGVWYRAEVLDLESHGKFQLLLVDFGITTEVGSAELCPLPDELAVFLPGQAFHCAMDRIVGYEPDGSWSAAVVEWFRDLCADCDFTLKSVYKNDVDNIWMVDLLCDGKAVKDMLSAQQWAIQTGSSQESTSTQSRKSASESSPVVQGLGPKVIGRQVSSKASPLPQSSKVENTSIQEDETPESTQSRKSVSESCVPVVPNVIGRQVSSKVLPLLLSSRVENTLIQEGETVIVTSIDTPGNFYVQKQHENSAEVMKELNSHCRAYDQVYYPKQVGELVAAVHNEHWYRAEVLSLDVSTASVFFIDYGYTMNIEVKNICALPLHFATALPKLAICCSIGGICGTCLDGSFSEAASMWFRDNYLDVTSTVTKVKLSDSPSLLLINLRNARSTKNARKSLLDYAMALTDSAAKSLNHSNQTIIEPQLDVLIDTVPPSVEPAVTEVLGISQQPTYFQDTPTVLRVGDVICVTHVISPVDFYVLTPADLQKVVSLSQPLQEYCTTSDSTGYRPQYIGEPVAAKFIGEWFRAEVVKSMSNDQFEVFFVDFGNTEVVGADDLHSLGEEFVKYPKQGVHCGLDGVRGNDSGQRFTEEAVECFKQLTSGPGVTVSEVCITGKKHLVSIVVSGSDIKEHLIAAGLAASAV